MNSASRQIPFSGGPIEAVGGWVDARRAVGVVIHNLDRGQVLLSASEHRVLTQGLSVASIVISRIQDGMTNICTEMGRALR